jgi:hypothetical protein
MPFEIPQASTYAIRKRDKLMPSEKQQADAIQKATNGHPKSYKLTPSEKPLAGPSVNPIADAIQKAMS